MAETTEQCSHGAITPHPSSDPRYPGFATCAVCGVRMTVAPTPAPEQQSAITALVEALGDDARTRHRFMHYDESRYPVSFDECEFTPCVRDRALLRQYGGNDE